MPGGLRVTYMNFATTACIACTSCLFRRITVARRSHQTTTIPLVKCQSGDVTTIEL